MTLLQVKAKIYQYTGLYLARTEERVYMYCSAYRPGNALYSLELGSWQAENGFTRYIGKYHKEVVKHRLLKNRCRHVGYGVLNFIQIALHVLIQDLGVK